MVKLSFTSFQGAELLGVAIGRRSYNFWPSLFANLGMICSPVGIYYDINAPAMGTLYAMDKFYVGSTSLLIQQAATSLSIASDPSHYLNLYVFPSRAAVCSE